MKDYLKLWLLYLVAIFALVSIIFLIIPLLHPMPFGYFNAVKVLLSELSPALLPITIFSSFVLTTVVFLQNNFGKSNDP